MRGVVFLCLLGVVLCNSDFLSRYKLEENPYAFPTAETFPKRFSRALLLDKLEGIGDQIDTLLVFGGRGSGKTTIRNHLLSTVNNSFAVYATNPRKWHSFFSTFNSVVRANISGQTSGSTCLEKTVCLTTTIPAHFLSSGQQLILLMRSFPWRLSSFSRSSPPKTLDGSRRIPLIARS